MLTHPTATVPARPWSPPAFPHLPKLHRPSRRALLTAVALIAGSLSLSAAPSPTPPTPSEVAALPSGAGPAGLPIRFEANRGQAGGQARFLARAGGTTLFLSDTEMALAQKGGTVRLALVGARPASVDGAGTLPGVTNYYVGADQTQWVRAVPSYAEVRYRRLLPGIDLVVHAHRGPLEYDYVVAPGADPAAIAMEVSGTTATSLEAGGALVMRVGDGAVRQDPPVAYQEIAGQRRPVDAAFTLEGNRIRFRLGTYDPSHPLVIDPTLSYSTFLGGSGDDEGQSVAVDAAGSAYVAGWTTSADFPTSPADDPNTDNARLAFVTKLSPSGSSLVYSNYFGGTGGDVAHSVALRGDNAYVVGETSSTDFPATAGAFSTKCGTDGNCAGGPDGFVTRFGPTGSLLYSTYLGGRGADRASSVTVDDTGRVFLTGTTNSTEFPTTAGSLQPQCGADGGCDANATFTDGQSTTGSTTYTSGSASFTGDDVGKEITGTNIPTSTTIAAVTDGSTITLSQPATADGAGLTFSIANTTFTDGASTDGSPTYSSALPHFVPADVGKGISGQFIPSDTTIVAVGSSTSVTLSALAEGTGSALTFTIDRHTFTDGASTIGTPHYTSATAAFTGADSGRPFSGGNIPEGTTIASVVNETTVALSQEPTAGGTNLTFTVGRNTVVGRGFATVNSVSFLDASRSFLPSDAGLSISGDHIDDGTTIVSVINNLTVQLSKPATGGGFGTFTIARDTRSDGVSASGSTTFTSASITFVATDAGKRITGTNIPAGTTIASVDSATSVTLSAPATASGTGLTFTIDRYTFHDGSATTESPPFTSATAAFMDSDVGRGISGQNLAHGASIAEVLSPTEVKLSPNATGTGTGLRFTIDRGRHRDQTKRYAFVTAIDPGGDGPGDLAYSTYLGGFGDTTGSGIALSGADLVVTGTTRAPDLPVGNGAFQGTKSDNADAFVTRLTPAGGGAGDLVASTFLGGGADESGNAIAVTADGIVVTGHTGSENFPVQGGLNQPCPVCNSETDAFVTKLTSDLSGLSYSTYLGGGGADAGLALGVDAAGVAVVAGTTGSTDFPVANPVLFDGGESDGFVTKLSPDGASIAYSTYLGSASFDDILGLALTAAGQPVVAGRTSSPGFMATPGALDTSCGGDGACGGADDAFVVRLSPGTLPAIASINPPRGPLTVATAVQIKGAGFTGATAVKFGGQPATFTVLNDETIQAASPPRDTSADVEVAVTGPDGTSLPNQGTLFRYGEGLFTPAPPCMIDGCGNAAAYLPTTGKVLFVSGDGERKAELYDPLTNTWSPTGSCANLPGQDAPESCTNGFPAMGMVVLGGPPAACGPNCGKALVTGGYGSNENLKAAFLYDPVAGTWHRTADMSQPRVNHSSTLLPDGKVLVAGGCVLRLRGCGPSGGAPQTAAELYDPLTETWTPTNPMGAARGAHAAILLDPAVGPCGSLCGKVLVAGGVANGAQQNTVEAYDPGPKTWVAQPSLKVRRYAFPAVQLGDGTVLAVGSYGVAAPTDEYFNTAAPAWTQLPDLPYQSASEGDAVRLPNGKVLSIPGGTSSPADGGAAQLYDPATHTWEKTGPLVRARGRQHVILLPPGPSSSCGLNCGKVLIAGENMDANFGTSAELYTPRPTVTGVTPSAVPAAGGTTVTLTGTGLTTVSSVRFGTVAGTNLSHDPDSPDTTLTATVPAQSSGTVDVTVTGPAGRSVVSAASKLTLAAAQATTTTTVTTSPGATTASTTTTTTTATSQPSVGGQQAAGEQGYAMTARDGGVFAFGSLPFAGSLGGTRLAQPIVGIEHTPSGRGYWLVSADGGVFAFGDAVFRGSTGGIRLARPIVGMRSTPSGNGYWLVAADGGVFAFGDAVFRGSTGGLRLNSPVVGMERSSSGAGYWLVAADGGVFAFGDAVFRGSTGGIRLARPVVGMSRSATGTGYLLVAADGGVFAFGDAVFRGSAGSMRLNSPIVGVARTAGGGGYWLCARDGGIFAFGNAGFAGSLGGAPPNQPIVGCSSRP